MANFRKYNDLLKPFSMRLTPTLKKQIEEIAIKKRVSQNDIIVEAVMAAVAAFLREEAST